MNDTPSTAPLERHPPSGEDWWRRVDAGAIVLTVNRRLSRDLADRYERTRVAAGHSVWSTPEILPLDAWLLARHDELLAIGDAVSPRLPNCLLREYWRAVIEDDGDAWLLDTDRMAEAAVAARALAAAWRIEPRSDPTQTADAEAFHRWHASLQARLRQAGVCDTELAIDLAISKLECTPSDFVLPSEVLVAGFLDLDLRQQRVFDALTQAGVAIARLQTTRRADVTRRASVDDDRLLREVAHEVRTAHLADPTVALAVMVPDLAARRRRVQRVFDAAFFPGASPETIDRIGRPYEFSYGTPLIEHEVVRTGLCLLDLLRGPIDARSASAILLSPHLIAAEDEADDRRRVERRLRDERIHSLDARRLASLLASDSRLAKALRSLESISRAGGRRRGRRAESVLRSDADRLSDALSALGWPGSGIDSVEYQAVEAFRACLDDLERVESLLGASLPASLARLRQLVRERVFQPETPTRPIRVLGRLESHGIDVDRLWLTGLDTDHWPPETAPSPFLSLEAQRRAGVPMASSTRLLERATRELELWCRSADRVSVHHALTRDGRTLMLASAIERLPVQDMPDVPAPRDPIFATTPGAVLESIADVTGPAIAADETVRGGAKLFEFQAACPFKAFATYRLGARELEEPGPGLDPRTHGNVLHRVLERFWEAVETQARLNALFETGEFEPMLIRTIELALDEERVDAAERTRERTRLLRLLAPWFEHFERLREPFTVVEREGTRECSVDGLPITLKVDRIDRLDSGQHVILDYKTGRGNRTDSWDRERIEAPQLPLYALTDETIDGIAFAQIAMHAYRFRGYTAEPDMLPAVQAHPEHDWPALRAHWHAALTDTAAEIRAGVAAVAPSPTACLYCALRPVCRIDDERRLESEADDDPVGRERTA